ncbi:MAG: RluA family pseudouridine synthase [Clostridiales bacterium]|nr:RluA family pseudouridine synthase [Clostridiales bacterium]
MLQILYEDKDLIVVWKPVGMESQSARGFGADMVSEIRKHLAGSLSTNSSTKPSTPGQAPYVGVIHRLDRPVSGILVYAKTKKAAAALSKQVSERQMDKKYLAVVCGKVDKSVDNLVDFLVKDGDNNCSRIVDKTVSGAKRAELSWRAVASVTDDVYGELTLMEIELKTGRHHQIRVQMAGHGMPLWGDRKYNPHCQGGDVALAAYHLSFRHPVSGRAMIFEKIPETEIFKKFNITSG